MRRGPAGETYSFSKVTRTSSSKTSVTKAWKTWHTGHVVSFLVAEIKSVASRAGQSHVKSRLLHGGRGERARGPRSYGFVCRFRDKLNEPLGIDGTPRKNARRRDPRENHALSNETWRRRKPRYLANIWRPCIREVRAQVPRYYDRVAARGSGHPPPESSARFFVYFSQNEPYNTLRFRRILRLWDPPSCFCVTARLLCGRHAEERASARVRGCEFPFRQSCDSFPWRRGSIGRPGQCYHATHLPTFLEKTLALLSYRRWHLTIFPPMKRIYFFHMFRYHFVVILKGSR